MALHLQTRRGTRHNRFSAVQLQQLRRHFFFHRARPDDQDANHRANSSPAAGSRKPVSCASQQQYPVYLSQSCQSAWELSSRETHAGRADLGGKPHGLREATGSLHDFDEIVSADLIAGKRTFDDFSTICNRTDRSGDETMAPSRVVATILVAALASVPATPALAQNAPTSARPADPHAAMLDRFQRDVSQLTELIQSNPDSVSLYSRRGDAHFFLADFPKALADYEKMAELQPRLGPRHWRRGLAWYYVGEWDKSARQFEQYFDTDKVDRENGIWRFYAQTRKLGISQARENLLPYERPDREPLEDVYRLCQGTMTPDELLEKIERADLTPGERAKREFYAELYVGLDYALKDEPAKALPHLERALASQWAPQAGYGPHYMWQIARLERDRARARLEFASQDR